MSWSIWKNRDWVALGADEARLLNEEQGGMVKLACPDGIYECDTKNMTYKVLGQDGLTLPMHFSTTPNVFPRKNDEPPSSLAAPRDAQPAVVEPRDPSSSRVPLFPEVLCGKGLWYMWKNGGWDAFDKDESGILNDDPSDTVFLARTEGTYECNKKALTYKVIEEGDASLPMMFIPTASPSQSVPPQSAQPAVAPSRYAERVLLWCDPKINDDNKYIEDYVLDRGIEHYRKFNCTEDLMQHWEDLGKPSENCRIMTCAVRSEDTRGMECGAPNYFAWAKLAARLREAGFTGRILVFCGDTSHLEDDRDTMKFNVTYTQRTKDAMDFATFCLQR